MLRADLHRRWSGLLVEIDTTIDANELERLHQQLSELEREAAATIEREAGVARLTDHECA